MFISIISFATTPDNFNSTKEVVNNQISYEQVIPAVLPAPTLVYGGEWRDANGNYLGEVWAVYNNGVFIGTILIPA